MQHIPSLILISILCVSVKLITKVQFFWEEKFSLILKSQLLIPSNQSAIALKFSKFSTVLTLKAHQTLILPPLVSSDRKSTRLNSSHAQ